MIRHRPHAKANEGISQSDWYKPSGTAHGLHVADTLDEVKEFAYGCFDRLDRNGDGFISIEELEEAMVDDRWSLREKSYVCFLLRRIDDISQSYDEEWDSKADEGMGVSRVDLQEYFKLIREKIAGP